MAIKPKISSRPSSRYLDRLLLSLRNQNSLPPSIWPRRRDNYVDRGDERPRLRRRRQCEPSSPPPSSSSSFSLDDGVQPPPPLKLSHPLLRTLEFTGGVASHHFPQALARLLVSGLSRHPLAAGRAIKALCSAPSSLHLAVSVFSDVDSPDAFLSNTILRAFISFNRAEEALSFFRRHAVPSSVPINHFSFPLLAKLCAVLGLVMDGRSLHSLVLRLGFESDQFVCNSMIYMYSSFNDVEAAREIFDSDFDSDLISWNSMIDGYMKNGMVNAARKLFDEMPAKDVISWNVMIAGHASVGDMDKAKLVFLEMPEKDVVSWNSLIDGYSKKGEVGAARHHFNQMPVKNLISWNTMLALYARNKNYRECLELFDCMIATGDIMPDEATFVSVLTACANLNDLERGKWVHSLIKNSASVIVLDALLLTSLLTMYSKSGAMEMAREVFDSMDERNAVSWNSMIMGYGMHGQGPKALELFMEMETVGMRPNQATFVCILSACAHAGMVLEGCWCFKRMIHQYGINLNKDHLGCMIDLLGRAGFLSNSNDLVKKMTTEPSPALLGSLMSACREHSAWQLGEIVGLKLIELDPCDIGPYILLSNIYAANSKWDKVESIREMITKNGLQKAAGVSLTKTSDNHLDHYVEDHTSICRRRMVFSMLSELGAIVKLNGREFDRKTSLQYI